MRGVVFEAVGSHSAGKMSDEQLHEIESVACPSALIGASNFFELAVAAAISLFGFESGAALLSGGVDE